jgi:hypothetical protein
MTYVLGVIHLGLGTTDTGPIAGIWIFRSFYAQIDKSARSRTGNRDPVASRSDRAASPGSGGRVVPLPVARGEQLWYFTASKVFAQMACTWSPAGNIELRRNAELLESCLKSVPKGQRDCGNHQWYKRFDPEGRCYDCEAGVRSSSLYP